MRDLSQALEDVRRECDGLTRAQEEREVAWERVQTDMEGNKRALDAATAERDALKRREEERERTTHKLHAELESTKQMLGGATAECDALKKQVPELERELEATRRALAMDESTAQQERALLVQDLRMQAAQQAQVSSTCGDRQTHNLSCTYTINTTPYSTFTARHSTA